MRQSPFALLENERSTAMDLNDIKKVYFIGIGGIGMSALARYFLSRGAEVHGYDRTSTPLTRSLEGEGMHLHYHEAPDLVPEGIDLVVYTRPFRLPTSNCNTDAPGVSNPKSGQKYWGLSVGG